MLSVNYLTSSIDMYLMVGLSICNEDLFLHKCIGVPWLKVNEGNKVNEDMSIE